MHRPTPLFAEAIYQTAFDRGVAEARDLYARLRASCEHIPSDWPRSKDAARTLVEDLLSPELSTPAKHLAITCAYSGAWIQWRRSGAGFRSSGIIRRVDVEQSPNVEPVRRCKIAGE